MTRHSLQSLRAVAAYAVVLRHLVEHLNHGFGLDLPSVYAGAAGVDLFFVLSGFVMVHATRPDETVRGFAARRIARIVPLYRAATGAAILMALAAPWTLARADLSWESIAASLAFVPRIDLEGHVQPILFVGWTLHLGMAFYAVFAISLLSPVRWRAAVAACLITALLIAARLAPESAASALYGQLVILEFAAGRLIAPALDTKAAERFFRRFPTWPLALVGAALFGAAVSIVPDGNERGFWYGAPAALLVAAGAAQDLFRTPTPQGRLARLGDASYAAYLTHVLIMAGPGAVVLKSLGASAMSAGVFAIGSVAATVWRSLVAPERFETPAGLWLRKKLLRKRAIARRPTGGPRGASEAA